MSTVSAVKPATKHLSSYTAILQEVKAAGLLEKTPAFYVKRFIILGVLSLSALGMMLLLSLNNNPLLAIPLAAFMGLLSAQYGFMAHEAAHRQVFNNNKWNDNAGLVLANLFAGLSYGFWLRKHNKHHQKPNQIGEDPDIAIRVLSFTTESLETKKGLERWLSNRQGWLFPVLLMFTGFDLLLDSIKSVTNSQRKLKHRWTEFGLMLIRQLTPFILFSLMFGIVWGAILWLVQMLVLGYNLGGSFALNHKGRPLVAENDKVDFFRRQVLTSRNIRSNWFSDNLMGGLNFQVEHHLFPSMPRPHLRAANKIVEKYCAEHNTALYTTGYWYGYKEVIKHLNQVGLSSNADPFVCPMVTSLRYSV